MTTPSYTSQAYIKLTGYSPQNKEKTYPIYLLGNVIVGVSKNITNENSVGSIINTNSGEFLVKETTDEILKLIDASIQ